MSMDELMASAVIERLIDRDESMRKQLGPVLALTRLLK